MLVVDSRTFPVHYEDFFSLSDCFRAFSCVLKTLLFREPYSQTLKERQELSYYMYLIISMVILARCEAMLSKKRLRKRVAET
jgi:hypothetical protein